MRNVVVRNIPRLAPEVAQRLAGMASPPCTRPGTHGPAEAVHASRSGKAAIAGRAVTVLSQPGDN